MKTLTSIWEKSNGEFWFKADYVSEPQYGGYCLQEAVRFIVNRGLLAEGDKVTIFGQDRTRSIRVVGDILSAD